MNAEKCYRPDCEGWVTGASDYCSPSCESRARVEVDPRGGWASCHDCGRVVHVSRYGALDPHAINPDMDDCCPGSGVIVVTA